MRVGVFFLLFLTLFMFSCNDDNTGGAKDKVCSKENPDGKCENGKICKQGTCEDVKQGCNPACDDSWQECNNNNECVAKTGFCVANTDCGDEQSCNTTTHLCESINNGCNSACDDSWQECNNNNECVAKTGFCTANTDCGDEQSCNTATHLCESANNGCNSACDDSWQECNADNECVAKTGFCTANTDCGDEQSCNTATHLCESANQGDVMYGVDLNACANEVIPDNNVIYVSVTGDNTADGSENHPFRTVFHAVEEAQSGDTIVIRGGTYVETNEIRFRLPDVTIMSYPGEWAVIDRSSSAFDGSEDSGLYLDVDADRTIVKCLEVVGGLYAISTETRWDWGEPNDRSGSSDIIIKNVKAHDSYTDVIKVKPESDNVKITYSEIYNSGPTLNHDDYCNAEGIDSVNADHLYVAHCYIHDICSTGLYFKGGGINSIAEYNKVENTGETGIALGFDTSPDFFDMNVNSEMYESIDCIARYNLIINAKGAGIGIHASKNAKVYHNTVIDSSSRLFHPIHLGIVTQDWVPEGKRPSNINPDIQNNIVVQNNVQDVGIVGIRNDDNEQLGNLSGLEGNMIIDNNCYYQAGGSAVFEDQRSAVGGAEPWTGNFEEWKTHINADTNSLETNPQLDSDYKPQNIQCGNMGI